jgi:excisionase family DNA binding protein
MRVPAPPPQRERPELMTPAEVAEVLRLSEKTIRGWLFAGRMPYIKVGRVVRVERAEFERWLKEHLFAA